MQDLVYSALVGTNTDVFPQVLKLYAKPGAAIADVTYGKGVFWKSVDVSIYDFRPSDLLTGVDFRHLHYEDASLDMLVLDPPYMHSPGGSAHQGHQNFEQYYQNNAIEGYPDIKYHDAVLRLYMDGIMEAKRVLKKTGVIVLKCQDEVCGGKMRLSSAELSHFLATQNWTVEDLFVVVSTRHPGVSRLHHQKHSRRNHSYFIVARNTPPAPLAMRFSTEYWP